MNNNELYEPCPCGSDKKFKFCCLAKQRESASRPALRVLPPMEGVHEEEWEPLDEAVIEAGKRECGKGLKG